jgi:uncharacterized protein (DUF433 family)
METSFAIVRTERGLTIAGTRITLYDIMDYIKDDWPARLIEHRLNLTERQVADALGYIETHRTEVETEYQEVLKQAQEIRAYWEERNRERLMANGSHLHFSGQEQLWEKLQAHKARIASVS